MSINLPPKDFGVNSVYLINATALNPLRFFFNNQSLKTMKKILLIIYLSLLAIAVFSQVGNRPFKNFGVNLFLNETKLLGFTPTKDQSRLGLAPDTDGNVNLWFYRMDVNDWFQITGDWVSQFDYLDSLINVVDSVNQLSHDSLFVTALANGGLAVTQQGALGRYASMSQNNMVDGLTGNKHTMNEADKLVGFDASGGNFPRDIPQHFILNGMRYESINVSGGSTFSQTLTRDENLFLIYGSGNGKAVINLDTLQNSGDVRRVVWIAIDLTDKAAQVIINGRDVSNVNTAIDTFSYKTKLILAVATHSNGWRLFDATWFQVESGTIGTTELATNAVTTIKIADANVTPQKLANSGVTAGAYTNANITVNDKGQVTAAANGSGGGGGSGSGVGKSFGLNAIYVYSSQFVSFAGIENRYTMSVDTNYVIVLDSAASTGGFGLVATNAISAGRYVKVICNDIPTVEVSFYSDTNQEQAQNGTGTFTSTPQTIFSSTSTTGGRVVNLYFLDWTVAGKRRIIRTQESWF